MNKKSLTPCFIPLLLFVFLAVLLSACGSRGNPSPVTPVGGLGLQVDSDQADQIIKPDESAGGCPPGSMKMTSQHLRANGSIALGPTGIDPEAPELPDNVQRVDLSLAQGEYVFRLGPVLGSNCNDAGPVSPQITVKFALTYRAHIDETADPVCVYRSRATFTQFNVLGAPNTLDAWILNRTKSNILKSLDAEVAGQMNQFVFAAQRASDAEVRCSWAELPADQ